MERNKSLKAAPVDAPDFIAKRLAEVLAEVWVLAFVRVFVCGVTLVCGLVDFMTVAIELRRGPKCIHIPQRLAYTASSDAIAHVRGLSRTRAGPISLQIRT